MGIYKREGKREKYGNIAVRKKEREILEYCRKEEERAIWVDGRDE